MKASSLKKNHDRSDGQEPSQSSLTSIVVHKSAQAEMSISNLMHSKRSTLATLDEVSVAEDSIVPLPNKLVLCHHNDVVEIDAIKARKVGANAIKQLWHGNFFDTGAALAKVEPLESEAKSIGWCINCFLRPAEFHDLCAQCDQHHGQSQCRYCRLTYTETDFIRQYRLAGCVERPNTCIECAHLIHLKGFPKFCEYCRREAAWTTSWTGGYSLTQTNMCDLQFYCSFCVEARKRTGAGPSTCKKCKHSCVFTHKRLGNAVVCVNCDIVNDGQQRGVAYHLRDPALNKYHKSLLAESKGPKAKLHSQLLHVKAELESKRAKKRDLEQRLRSQTTNMPPPAENCIKRRKIEELAIRKATLEAVLHARNTFVAHRTRDVNYQARKQMIVGTSTQVRLSNIAKGSKQQMEQLKISSDLAQKSRQEGQSQDSEVKEKQHDSVKAEAADLFGEDET